MLPVTFATPKNNISGPVLPDIVQEANRYAQGRICVEEFHPLVLRRHWFRLRQVRDTSTVKYNIFIRMDGDPVPIAS